MSKSPLADDILCGVPVIAEYTGEPERRIRHLIAAHNFPHFKRGQIIYSRKSWVERYYNGETVKTNGAAEK